jgi:hypothetical protein
VTQFRSDFKAVPGQALRLEKSLLALLKLQKPAPSSFSLGRGRVRATFNIVDLMEEAR